MNQQSVCVEKGTFRSRLIPAAAVFFALSALCGIAAVGLLFHPESIPAVLRDMTLSEIYDRGAQQTWLVIYIAVTVVNCIAVLVLTLGIGQVLLGRHHQGMDLMYKFAKWTLVGVNVSGAATLVYFVFRAVRYVLMCVSVNGGLIPLVSMVIMEGLMAAQAGFLFVKLRQFLSCAEDTTASIGYTLTSGKLDAPTIPAFVATGFFVLSLFDIGIALDRFFTFIHKQKGLSVIYDFPVTEDPIQIASGAAFLLAGVGSILLWLYLKDYKRKSERLLFRRVRE